MKKTLNVALPKGRLGEKAYAILERAGFREILHTSTGGTIASHCGPGTLGILFFRK